MYLSIRGIDVITTRPKVPALRACSSAVTSWLDR